MNHVCPHCQGNHTLSQCPTWRVEQAQRDFNNGVLLSRTTIAHLLYMAVLRAPAPPTGEVLSFDDMGFGWSNNGKLSITRRGPMRPDGFIKNADWYHWAKLVIDMAQKPAPAIVEDDLIELICPDATVTGVNVNKLAAMCNTGESF